MQMSARGAQKKRDESKKLPMYSKQWLPGDQLRVFYPIFWKDGRPEIAVGAVWGHSVSDIKGLGLHTAFIPSTTEFDENRLPVGPADVTYQFSRIARVFVNGQKRVEEQMVESKPWPTEAAKKDALKAIDEKYDTKNNPKAVRPIISPVQFYISTEVLSVKIANGAPIKDSLTLTSAPLSSAVITKLYGILDDPKYAPAEGAEFIEVEWKYPVDTDKGQSSRNASPAGLTSEYRMENAYPEMYALAAQMFPSVAKDAETITRRATRSVDPAKVQGALMNYSIMNSEYLDQAIDEDVEILCKNVAVIEHIGVLNSLKTQTLIDQLKAELEKYKSSQQEIFNNALPNPAEAASGASDTIPDDVAGEVAQADSELPDLSGVTGSPTIDSLLNNQDNGSVVPSAADSRAMAAAGITSSAKLDDSLLDEVNLGDLS